MQTLIRVNPLREKLIITVVSCLFLMSGAATLLVSCAYADSPGDLSGKPVVTIIARGSQSYYLGEKVYLSGLNTESDTTYLFITGPNLPGGGGNLTSPRQGVVSGSPDSFTIVKTKPDKSWGYSFYTANLPFDAGTYTLYAVSRPLAHNQSGDSATYGTVGLILKKPFITAEISPSTVIKGQPFSVTGAAEGLPQSVQVWIFGKNRYMKATTIVNPDASFRYEVRQEVTSSLDSGQHFVIVQHSMQNNRFDIDTRGDYVRNLNVNNDTDLFRVSGPGSLQGSDAVDALIATFSDPGMQNVDTYTVIPFQVTDAGSPVPRVSAAATAPVHQTKQNDLLGAIGEVFRSFLKG